LSAYLTAVNRLRTVKILSVKNETPTVKSFTFHDKLCAKAEPGQFGMVWIPGVDEVPMTLSAMSADRLSAITVEKVGTATKALHKMKVGDIIGIRGPFGNSFKPIKGKVMIVGGGTGLASLAPLAEKIADSNGEITFFLGAKTHSQLLFLERVKTALSRVRGKIIAVTEDGSHGLKGLVTEPAEQLLAKERFDMVYTCGPEKMVYKMFTLTERYKTPLQASLERLMRCAMGLCGTCVIGRFRVCRDGPVFSGQQLREVKDEFGCFKRGFDGRRLPFE